MNLEIIMDNRVESHIFVFKPLQHLILMSTSTLDIHHGSISVVMS